MINKCVGQKRNVFRKAITIIKEEGFVGFLKAIKYRSLTILSPIIIFMKPKCFFVFRNRKLKYFLHIYNLTWMNERIVEVPIVMDYIKRFRAKKILEFGAVLHHYYNVNWDVLDKFEKGKGIINKDVVNFKPSEKYDLIVSISTLEHVGFADGIKNPMKPVKAVRNLKENCLKKNGRIIITLPLAYNKEMDKLLFNEKIHFDELFFLKRISRSNKWKEVTANEVKGTKLGTPYYHVNAIAVGIIKKS